MSEPSVILVNEQDQEQGHLGKLAAHQQGRLHRAFSIFILRQTQDGYQTLLQQRAQEKYHSGGLWTNSCCSHPNPGQSLITAAQTRLLAEFGFTVPLEDIGHFIYQAKLDGGLTEHELDHVLIGFDDGQTPHPDPSEIMAWRWCDISELRQALTIHPKDYTAWLSPALALVEQYIIK